MLTRVGVLLILRDCEAYLGYLFSRFDDLEETYRGKVAFSYFIYENDSADTTPVLLTQWSEAPRYKDRVQLLCERQATEYVKDGTTCDRIQRIVNARNRLLDECRHSLAETDKTLVIDSNIYFEISDLQAILNISESEHAAIVTCNTICVNINNDSKRAAALDVPPDLPYYTFQHYYDTYAFVDSEQRLLYPQCPSPLCKDPTCETCPYKWTTNQEVLRVASAWGGFVLIDSAIFKHDDIKWELLTVEEAMQQGIIKTSRYLARSQTNAICEHIPFCKKTCEKLGKPCVVATNVAPYWMR
jgi:hypothetical protein